MLKQQKTKRFTKDKSFPLSKGFTIVEVLVSIVIVAIMVLATTSIFLYIRRIENHVLTRGNMLNEVTKVFNVFSSDPEEFENNILLVFDGKIETNAKDNGEKEIILYYTSNFYPSLNGSKSLVCDWIKDNDTTYTLSIEFKQPYDNFPKPEALTRTIKVG